MKFREFFVLSEVLDVEKDPVDDIEFTTHPYSSSTLIYTYFDENETKFEGSFSRTEHEILDGLTVYGYSVIFTADGSTRLRNQHKAPTTYTPLLRAIKKFIEEKQPDMLEFYGAYPEQDVMYQAFIKRFLSDKPGKPPHQIFYPVDKTHIISKKFFLALPSDQQDQVSYKIENAEEDRLAHVDQVKGDKINKRRILTRIGQAIGKFIIRDDFWGAKLYFGLERSDYQPLGMKVLYIDEEYVNTDTINFTDNMIIADLHDILAHPKLKPIIEWLMSTLFGPTQQKLPGEDEWDWRHRSRGLVRKKEVLEKYLPPAAIDQLRRIFYKLYPQQSPKPNPNPQKIPSVQSPRPLHRPPARDIMQGDRWRTMNPQDLVAGNYE